MSFEAWNGEIWERSKRVIRPCRTHQSRLDRALKHPPHILRILNSQLPHGAGCSFLVPVSGADPIHLRSRSDFR